MWTDKETNRNFLNFRAVAASAAEVIVQANVSWRTSKGLPFAQVAIPSPRLDESSAVRAADEMPSANPD